MGDQGNFGRGGQQNRQLQVWSRHGQSVTLIATQASGFLAWRKGRPAVIMEALARAKRLRTEALTAQAARLGEGTARTVRNAERAKKHGMVEKSAGESGVAGNLKPLHFRPRFQWVHETQNK